MFLTKFVRKPEKFINDLNFSIFTPSEDKIPNPVHKPKDIP